MSEFFTVLIYSPNTFLSPFEQDLNYRNSCLRNQALQTHHCPKGLSNSLEEPETEPANWNFQPGADRQRIAIPAME